ncbi:hypothetical protein FHG87_017000 [Trinorchestia longiramus]|nr:hypothetical protein FHG87_017000 [Trinorchestia longiramus]
MHRQSRRWEAERRFMEVDEAVEAVDSSIEYKNELICGRTEELAASSTLLLRGKLLDRLLNLSLEEIRTLLIRYFSRVIDIRIEFRKQEIAYTELELQFEDQSRLLQKLEWSYEQASLDMERRCAVQQRHFLHYLHKLFRHIDAQETSMQAAKETAVPITSVGATGDAGLDKSGPTESDVRQLEMSLYYYKQQCQQLKNLVRQQQGLGYDFQPLYQQLQQQHRQLPSREPAEGSNKVKSDSGKGAGISLKLATLGPGSSLFSPSRDLRSQEETQAITTAPEDPALLHPSGHYPSVAPGTSRHGERNASNPGARNQNPALGTFDGTAADSNGRNQDPCVPDACDHNASVTGAHDRNPFSRNARPQPRLRHRRPPASRSSKYREWSAPKRADHGMDDVENIALRPLNTQRSSAAAADLRNSRAVPSKWR